MVAKYPPIENFKEKYLELKSQYKTDVEIAREFFISISLLKKYKIEHQVPDIRKPRKNEQNVSEEEIKIALSNGLTRRQVLQRVRWNGWSNKKAITAPIGFQKRGRNRV